jgi:hypothetical protein
MYDEEYLITTAVIILLMAPGFSLLEAVSPQLQLYPKKLSIHGLEG